MPYTKSYSRRRRPTYRRRGATRKPLNYRQARATKRIVRKELDKKIENKYTFQSITNSVGTALDTNSMTRGTDLIPQGTARNERIGNKIMLRRLTIRGKLVLAASDSLSRIRLMIVRCIKDNYTPTLADLVHDDTATYSILSPPNYVLMKGKYQILYDRRWHLDDAFQDSTDFNISLRLNRPVYYDDAGNTIKGAIVMCFWADDGTYDITAAYTSYLSYEDA